MNPAVRSTGVSWMDALLAERARQSREEQFIERTRRARAPMPPGGPVDFYKELGFPPVQTVPLHPWSDTVGLSRRSARPSQFPPPRPSPPSPASPFTFTEDMSPAERSVMLRYGPDMLAAARGGVQVGGGPASLLMTQRPAARGGAGVLDYLLTALSTIGAPLARMGMLRQGSSGPSGNLAPAQWAGYQEGFGATPGFNLYNLTKPIQGHPVGSTVGEQTLKALGYTLPRAGTP